MYKFNNTIEPLWITRSHCEKNMEVKSHNHEHYYHLVYVITGCFEFIINGNLYSLGENMLNIAKPGDIQSWKNTQERAVDTYEIKFSVFDNDLKDALSRLPNIIFGNLFSSTLLKKIADENKLVNQDYQEYISIYLNALLYDLVRIETPYLFEQPKNKNTRNPTQVVIKYIQDNYYKDLSLDRIAEATYFNKSYLSTMFKKNEDITINDYIYKFRIYKACELIAYSDLTISQVKSMVGFKNAQHFSRMFTKYIGIPPAEYRSATPKQFVRYDNTDNKFNLEVLPVRSGCIYEVNSDTGYFKSKDSNKDNSL